MELLKAFAIQIDLEAGQTVTPAGVAPLFRIGQKGTSLFAGEADCRRTETGALYAFDDLTVEVRLTLKETQAEWRIQVTEGECDYIDFPLLLVPRSRRVAKC